MNRPSKLLARAVAGALGVLPFAAAAQQAEKVEKIEVTGSNIKRLDAETALPVQIVTRQGLKLAAEQAARRRNRLHGRQTVGVTPPRFEVRRGQGSRIGWFRQQAIHSPVLTNNLPTHQIVSCCRCWVALTKL